ncbi:MAG: AI-2E family transporter [Pyrinomonadaceae bacterium]|nr:AI-2E family transporter [Pyrinomonadaceae bacterium]
MAETPKTSKSFISRVMIVVAMVCLVVLGSALIYFTFDVILLIFAAALLAIFLHGLADILRKWVPLSEGWLVMLVAVLLLLVVAGAVAVLAPSVAEQVRVLRVEIPKSAQNAGQYLSQFGWGQTLIAQLPSADDVMAKLDAASVMTRVGGFFSSTVGAVGNVLVTILLAIYLASEPRYYSAGIIRFFPKEKRERVSEILSSIYQTLRWWLIGKAASMLFIGVLTWIGLSILGVPLALTLGLIAGLLSFIPNFGPILSAIPAILLAFIDSPISALYVLGLYGGVQVIESNVVTPIIERETVELAPALTIIFQLALGAMIGGLGLVLATPLLAMVVVIVKMVYFEDVLGDKEVPIEAFTEESPA